MEYLTLKSLQCQTYLIRKKRSRNGKHCTINYWISLQYNYLVKSVSNNATNVKN